MAWRRPPDDSIISDESDIDGGIGVRVLQHLTDDTGDGVGKPAQQRKRWTLVVVVVALMCVASLCMLGRWSLLQKSTKSMDISNLQETEVGPTPPPESPQGGTLEPGPGCPSVCGSFVACSLNIASENNLYPLGIFQAFGIFPFAEGLKPTIALNRLFNKQLIPYSPDFQCPGTDCFIPNAFVNDDFCDCPINCADEIAHRCDSCGIDLINNSEAVVPGVGCPNFCGGLNDLSDINCLGTGSSTAPRFACPDSACEIDAIFVNDNRCDCPFTCADETNWTCDNCSCPTICGVAVFDCDGSGVYNCPISSANQTCNIPGAKVGNGVCDCPGSCKDEAPAPPLQFGQFIPDCDSCTCPTACGQNVGVLGSCAFEQLLTLFSPFDCGNGCLIPNLPPETDASRFGFGFVRGLVQDGFCDCPGTCADEADEDHPFEIPFAPPDWTCETCNCPTRCLAGRSEVDCGELYFQCPGSDCKVALHAINDNACNCPGCEDEKAWTCDSCDFGCPEQNVCFQAPPCRAAVFECGQSANRCLLQGIQVNDNICDCPNCEDEEFWDCNNCTCPSTCSLAAGQREFLWKIRRCGMPQDNFPDVLIQCPGARDPATPDGACGISPALLGNNRCDCPGSCADENFDGVQNSATADPNPCLCQRQDGLLPADCPQNCGDEVPECPFRCQPQSDSFPGLEVPCHVPISAKNDGRCDCPGACDDEGGRFTCSSFLTEPTPDTDECFCPRACGDSIELDLSQCPGSSQESFCKESLRTLGVAVCEDPFFQQPCGRYCLPQTDSPRSSASRLMHTQGAQGVGVAARDPEATILMAMGFNQTRNAPRAPTAQHHQTPNSKQSARSERKLSESLPVGSRGVLQGLTDCTAAIEEAMTSLRKGAGTGLKVLEEALKRSFTDGAIGGSVAKAFEGSGEGPAFTASLRRAIIHDAVEMFLTPLKDREQKQQAVFSKEFKDGSQAEQRLLNTRARRKPAQSTKAKDDDDEGAVNFVDEILSELVFMVYVHLNTQKSKPTLSARGGRHRQAKSRISDSSFWDGDEGRDEGGFGGQRRLQVDGSDLSDVLLNSLRPADAFDCPAVAGCALPRAFVNDRRCDCPDTCADEDAFTCETCVPAVPFGIQNQQPTATDIGVAVGVSLGAALGIGLGVGLGLASGLGAVFIAQGVVQFTVMNVEEFTSSPEVQLGMKRAFLRLAEMEIAEEAVTLNWACAATALSQITAKLRRLAEMVALCFEIQIEGETQSMEACKVLSSTSPGGVQKVIEEELGDAGADTSIDVVKWEADPNPKSFNPNKRTQPVMPFLPPLNQGVNLG